MKTKWWSARGANCKSSSSAVKQQRLSLNMHNVAGLFVVLAAGLAAAVASVAFEFWLRSRVNARLDKVHIVRLRTDVAIVTIRKRFPVCAWFHIVTVLRDIFSDHCARRWRES